MRSMPGSRVYYTRVLWTYFMWKKRSPCLDEGILVEVLECPHPAVFVFHAKAYAPRTNGSTISCWLPVSDGDYLKELLRAATVV